MKCPYCAEEIKDEAIVCRYCGRDLLLIKLMEKLTLLDKEISKVRDEVSALQQPRTPAHEPGPDISPVSVALVVLLPALISIGTFWFPQFILLSLIMPLPFGLWLGIRWRGRHVGYYALLGLGVGIIEMAAYLITIATGPEPLQLSDWSAALVMYVMGATLLFISGALFGDLVERIRYPDQARPGLPERVVGKRWALGIRALGPILIAALPPFIAGSFGLLQNLIAP